MHGRSAPKQIKKYIHNKGTDNQLFDINGYKDEKDDELEIVEKTTLLIEYLFHEEDIDYLKQHKITRVKKHSIVTLSLTYKTSIRFLKAMCNFDNELIVKFGDYYDFGVRFEKTVQKHCADKKDI